MDMQGGDTWFRLCEEINALGQELALPLELSSGNPQGNLILLLYGRILSLFQQCIEYARRGRFSRARGLAHALLDTLMALAAVMQNALFSRYFFEAGQVQHIFRSRKRRPLPGDLGQVISRLTGPGLAREAGMESYYHELLDTLLSPSPLVPHGGHDYPTPIDGSDLRTLLQPACEGLLLASRLLADFFKTHSLDKEYQRLWETYAALCQPR